MQAQVTTSTLPDTAGNFSSAALSPGHDWNSDIQRTDYQSVEELYEHAKLTAGQFLEFMLQIRGSIDSNLALKIDSLLKPLESLQRKMHDPSVNYKVREICDPLRVTFIVDDISQLKDAINKIAGLKECTSTKNEFVEPNEVSHFSTFKARLEIIAPDGRPIKCEVQVQHQGMLRANELTARLSASARAMERASIDMANAFRSNEKSYQRHLNDLNATGDFINRVKRLIHDSARIAAGLLELIPADKRNNYIVDGVALGPVPRYARTVMLFLPDAFIRRVKCKAPMTSRGIIDDFKLV